MWKPNVSPSSPKLCVLAGDAMSGKIKRGSSTFVGNHVDDGGTGLGWEPGHKAAFGQSEGPRRIEEGGSLGIKPITLKQFHHTLHALPRNDRSNDRLQNLDI